MAPTLPAINSGQKLRIFMLYFLVVSTTEGADAHQPMLTGITGNEPALQGWVEGGRLNLSHAQFPMLERPAVHGLGVQTVVFFTEVEVGGVQGGDFQHVAVFESIEQGIGYGSHGDQSFNWREAMIAHHSHRTCAEHKTHAQHRTNVGAGLLAKAVGQLALMLDVPPSSRASPLPQGIAFGC